MKCPYCEGDNYETWEEYGDLAGDDLDDFSEKGYYKVDACQNCECDLDERIKKKTNRRVK